MLARFATALALTCAAALSPALAADKTDYARPLLILFPENAPYSPLRAALGKMLYFDPRLSGAQNMSCASCHNPSFGWEVPTEGPIGAQNTMLGRQAPTILNVAWMPHYFWDGRADTLEHQAAGPITADVEMNASLDDVAERLGRIATYRKGFEQAFPREGLTPDTILTAIATYERTVVSGWSPFDRWVEGDEAAISPAAQRGFDLFTGRALCADCHSGWNFTDNAFHDIGIATDDVGRAKLDPENPLAQHAFKTPGLRNVVHRAPYMHNGSAPNLETVMNHYISGGIERPSLSPQMRSLDLNEEDVADLLAFLESLSAEEAAVPTPVLPVD